MPPSWLRKLLILNSEHIISSHPDYMHGGFKPSSYADMMKWRFSHLKHGVSSNDQSHWLNNKPIDLLVTSSPAEHMSITADDTPYTYTTKETQFTGLARHDSLLTKVQNSSFQQADIILFMPTWRGSLSNATSEGEIADSDYVYYWGSLLRSSTLTQLAKRHGKRLVLMPHTNAVPYLKHFRIPREVEVYTKADIGVQELLSRCLTIITDYSSVSFEIAYLRRSVFYYQFDKDNFYAGDHNWRKGYFDYSHDGFGPVAFDEATLLSRITELLSNNGQIEKKYLDRMKTALPLVDGLACQRVYDAINRLKGFSHA